MAETVWILFTREKKVGARHYVTLVTSGGQSGFIKCDAAMKFELKPSRNEEGNLCVRARHAGLVYSLVHMAVDL